jgi:hypothetical protein
MSKVSYPILVVALLVGLLVWPAGTRATEYFSPVAELPSPCIRESPTGYFSYPNDVMMQNMVMIRESPTGQALPGPGGGAHIDSFFDIFIEVSTDGGGTWTGATGYPARSFFDIFVNHGGGGGGGAILYPMEVLSLDLSPMPGVQIRESPTRASDGMTTVRTVPGGYMIDSFFDIFTEVSMDGGHTWVPSEGPPVHMEGTPEPATLSVLALSGLALLRRRR